jgi:hypothetical protein
MKIMKWNPKPLIQVESITIVSGGEDWKIKPWYVH